MFGWAISRTHSISLYNQQYAGHTTLKQSCSHNWPKTRDLKKKTMPICKFVSFNCVSISCAREYLVTIGSPSWVSWPIRRRILCSDRSRGCRQIPLYTLSGTLCFGDKLIAPSPTSSMPKRLTEFCVLIEKPHGCPLATEAIHLILKTDICQENTCLIKIFHCHITS